MYHKTKLCGFKVKIIFTVHRGFPPFLTPFPKETANVVSDIFPCRLK